MVGVVLGAAVLLAGTTPGDSVLLGVRVTPDTVTVGTPFRVTVRVRAPRGARIAFAPGPDSSGAVQALDTRVVTDGPDTAVTEATATYRLAAWDVGRQSISIPDVIVRLPGGADRPVPLAGLSVVVRRLTAPRAPPKLARAILPPVEPWWWRWAIGAAALLLLLLVLRWLSHRARRPAPARPLDPYGDAVRALAHIDRLGLIEAGERGRFVALIAQVVRDYLAGRIEQAVLSLTTGELLDALRGDARVPLDRLGAVLDASDLVKFAHQQMNAERAGEVAREARRVIDDIDAAAVAAVAVAAKVA